MKKIFFLFTIGLLLSSCLKNPDQVRVFTELEETKPGYDCIFIMNEDAVPVGTYQNCDPLGQWIQTNLNTEELSILDFPDTITTPLASNVKIRRAFAYPNPVSLNESLNIGFTGLNQHTAKVKLAVINTSNNTILQTTVLSDGTDIIQLNVASNLFDPSTFYRVYFQILGDQDEAFMEGYGNIFICRSSPVDNLTECF